MASAESDQSLLCAQWVVKDTRFPHADSKDSDRIGRMQGHFVGFVTLRKCVNAVAQEEVSSERRRVFEDNLGINCIVSP